MTLFTFLYILHPYMVYILYVFQSIVHVHSNIKSKIKLAYVSLCVKYEIRKTIYPLRNSALAMLLKAE